MRGLRPWVHKQTAKLSPAMRVSPRQRARIKMHQQSVTALVALSTALMTCCYLSSHLLPPATAYELPAEPDLAVSQQDATAALNESAGSQLLVPPDYVIDDFLDSEAGYLDTPVQDPATPTKSLTRRQVEDDQQAPPLLLFDDTPASSSPAVAAALFQDLEPANSGFSYPLANFHPFDQQQANSKTRQRQNLALGYVANNLQAQDEQQQQQQAEGQLIDLSQESARPAANKIGPSFTREPPSFLHYLNSSDLIIQCAASGQPQPTITWWQKSGQQLKVGSLLDKRYVRYDNSLVISAFRAHEFEPEIHAASYRCQASNALGTIVSRDVVINAVIDQEYEASVSDQFVTVDNDALFKCQLAPQVRDFHQVIGWLEDGQQLVALSAATPASPASVFASALAGKTPVAAAETAAGPNKRRHGQRSQQQQRALMLPDGQLLIQRVQLRDANKSYRCQIRNLLNGRLSSSTISGRLFVTDANESGASPRIIEGPRAVSTGRLADQMLLVCLAQGSPQPTIRWFRWQAGQTSTGAAGSEEAAWLELAPVASSAQVAAAAAVQANSSAQQQQNQTRHLVSSEGNLLLISRLAASDQRARFKCLANNSYGAHQLETELRLDLWPAGKAIELRPQREFIQEQQQQVIRGVESENTARPSLVLNCTVRATSQPMIGLEWLHNGRPLFSIALLNFQHLVQHQQHQAPLNLLGANVGEFDSSSFLNQQNNHQTMVMNTNQSWPWSLFDNPNQELVLSEYLSAGSSTSDHQGDTGSENTQQQQHVITSSASLLTLSQQPIIDNSGTPVQSNGPTASKRIWQSLRMTQQQDQLLYQLAFSSLKRSDRGSYQCRTRSLALNGGGPPTSAASQATAATTGGLVSPQVSNNIKVITSHQTSQLLLEDTPPKFVDTFQSVLVGQGGGQGDASSSANQRQMLLQPQVSLKCVASGSPLPEISWQLSGFPVPESNRFRVGDYVTRDGLIVSFVNISNVQPEDGGLYECSASNDVGQLRHASWLNVTGPAHIRPMPRVAAVAGGALSIMCPVGGWPVEQISWFQNSTKLPANHRQKVFPNGTLLISDLNEVLDTGQYACQAKSAGSDHFALQQVQVSIRVPPVVEPLALAKSLHRGQRYNMMCTVTRGDLPVSIRWFKDGRPVGGGDRLQSAAAPQAPRPKLLGDPQQPLDITALGGANQETGVGLEDRTGGLAIKQLDPYSSTLTFASLQAHHRGEYSCEATNEVGRANQSSSLVIHVPPEWTIEPSDLSVTIGRTAVIDCQAEGVPAARVEWRLSQDLYREPPSEFKPIISSLYMRVFENGSLIIYNTQRTDAGYYLCQANNGIGPGISRVIKLTVHVAAHFKTKIRNELVRRGQPARLKCEALGDLPIEINWLKDKLPLYSQEEPRYALTRTPLSDGIVSELVIQETDRSDSALFTCFTQNQFGSDDTNIQLIVQGPPDAPEDARVLDSDARSAKLTWTPGHSGNSPISKYLLMCLQPVSGGQSAGAATTTGIGSGSMQWINATIGGSESSYLMQGLVPLTEYHCHLVAVNALGSSRMPTEPPIKFSTQDEAPSLPPMLVKAQPLSSRTIRVRWRAPERRHQQHYGLTAAYYVGYKLYRPTTGGAGDQQVAVSTAAGGGGGGSSANAAANKQHQDTFIYKTVEFASAPPGGPTPTLDKSDMNNNNRTGLSAGIEQECLLTGLRRGQKYLITVQPFNGRGAGPTSEPTLAETWRVDVPDSPSLRMISRTTHSIHLAWRVASNSGSAQQHNMASAAASKLVRSSSAHFNHYHQNHLQAHHPPMSSSASIYDGFAETGSGPPSSSARLISSSSDDSQMAGEINNAGRYPGAQQHNVADALTPEELAAEQAQINEPILGFVLTRKQLAPAATPSSGLGQQQVAETPADGKQLPTISAQQQVIETSLPSDHTSQIVDQLTCGTRYQFTIAAINSVGVSAPSEPLVVKTEGSLPVAPDRNSLLSLNASSVVINLGAWHNGACSMRSFDILFKPSRSRQWTTLTNYQISQGAAGAASSSGGDSSNANLIRSASGGGDQSISRSLIAQHQHSDTNSSLQMAQRSTGGMRANGNGPGQQQQQLDNGTIVLDDLASSVNYDLKILATNEAGTTEAFYTFNTDGNSISSLDQQWSTGGEFRFSGDASLGDLFSGPLLGATLLPLLLLLLLVSLSLSTGCILFARRRHASPSNCSLSISSRSNQSSSNYCTTTATTTTTTTAPGTSGASLGENHHNHHAHHQLSLAGDSPHTTRGLLAGDSHRGLDDSSPLMAARHHHNQQQQQMRLSDIYGTNHRLTTHQQADASIKATPHYAYLTAGRPGHASRHLAPRPSSPPSTDITSVMNGSGGGGGDGEETEMCLGASALNISGAGEHHAHHANTIHPKQRSSLQQSYYAAAAQTHQLNLKSSTLPSNCHNQQLASMQKLMAQQRQQQQAALDSSQQQELMNSYMAANMQHELCDQTGTMDQMDETGAQESAAAAYALQVAALQAAAGNGQQFDAGDPCNLANLSLQLDQQQRHQQQVYATVKRGCPRPSMQQQRQALCEYNTIYQCPAAAAAAAVAAVAEAAAHHQQQQQQSELIINQCSCTSGNATGLQVPSNVQDQQAQANNNGQTYCGYQQQPQAVAGQQHSDYQSLRQINS